MKEHARFSISGEVRRSWANDKGTFARVSVIASIDGRERSIDVKAFAARVVATVSKLNEGDTVIIVGEVQSEKLTDKTRQEVQVDGRAVWVPSLVASEIHLTPAGERERPARAPMSKQHIENQDRQDDDIPF